MFQRGWFHIDVARGDILPELLDAVRQYGPARVQALSERALDELVQPGRFAGVVVHVTTTSLPWLERLIARAPALPVLALLDAADRALINRLQACGVTTALLPLQLPNAVSFAQRALCSSFVPCDRMARVLTHFAESRALTAREVQLLSYCLGDEPRARVRRRLGITENTLKTQVRGLLRKCGERNLDALAKNLLRTALVTSAEMLASYGPAAESTQPHLAPLEAAS